MSPSFCVVIPMYNEEAGADRCVRTVCAALATFTQRSQLIVVNDGSRDRTGQILKGVGTMDGRLMVVDQPENRGYGAALRTGMSVARKAGFDYTLFMDSDLTNDPADIRRFVEKMDEGFDVIKATRYSRGGRVSGVPAYRVWISRAGNRLASLLFGLPLRDCTNGFRAVKTALLGRMTLTENRFPIIMEELYWCRFLARSFAEVPVTLTDRAQGQRPTSFVYRPSVFWQYLKYPLKAAMGRRPGGGDAS